MTAQMTLLLLLLAVAVLELVAGVHWLRTDRPLQPPRSHADWTLGSLPSHGYGRTGA